MDKRNNTVKVRLTDSELEYLKSLADEANMSMAEVLRDNLGKLTVRNRKDEQERLKIQNYFNANLNMITRWVNTYKSDADALEVIKNLVELERHFRDLNP